MKYKIDKIRNAPLLDFYIYFRIEFLFIPLFFNKPYYTIYLALHEMVTKTSNCLNNYIELNITKYTPLSMFNCNLF